MLCAGAGAGRGGGQPDRPCRLWGGGGLPAGALAGRPACAGSLAGFQPGRFVHHGRRGASDLG